MNAMTRILNALAFANVNNLSEFRTLLRQIDEPSAPGPQSTPRGPLSTASDSSSVTPVIRHIPGAL